MKLQEMTEEPARGESWLHIALSGLVDLVFTDTFTADAGWRGGW